MRLLNSLHTVYEVARITLPCFGEALVGTLDRETADRRLRSFGERVVANTGIQLEVEGRERVPPERAFVYMSNHQSHMDIPVLYSIVPTETLRMVAKTELFRIPFWRRPLTAAGFIEVDRKDHQRAVESMQRAEQQIRSGVSIWIAPEGTRTRSGEIMPLKKGGFHLAMQTETPIIPIAISGTRQVLPAGSILTSKGQPVRVVFGEPIEVVGKPMSELMAAVDGFLRAHVSPA